MKERVQIKHDTAENWAKAVNFKPLAGEMVIYDGIIEDGNYIEMPRLKIGDGVHTVNELPFLAMNSETKQPEWNYTDGTLKLG